MRGMCVCARALARAYVYNYVCLHVYMHVHMLELCYFLVHLL